MTVALSAGSLRGGVPVSCNCLVEDAGKLTSRSSGSMKGQKGLVEIDKVSSIVR